jgi:hypothetical protein
MRDKQRIFEFTVTPGARSFTVSLQGPVRRSEHRFSTATKARAWIDKKLRELQEAVTTHTDLPRPKVFIDGEEVIDWFKFEKPVIRWFHGKEAEDIPAGSVVLVRRKIPGQATRYDVENCHRPDWVEGSLDRPGQWSWAIIELPEESERT